MLRTIFFSTLLINFAPVSFAASSAEQTDAVLAAKVQFLQKENKALQQINSDLEKRIKKIEDSLPGVNTAITNAQQSANTAQQSANNAKAAADAHSVSYTSVSFAHLQSFHGGCVPAGANSPNCYAASHRYCNSIGYSAGMIQEVGGDAFGVACVR